MQPVLLNFIVVGVVVIPGAVVLVLVMRWCIRRLRTLLLESTGPWRWVGIILLGSVVLAIGAYLAVGAIGFISLAVGVVSLAIE